MRRLLRVFFSCPCSASLYHRVIHSKAVSSRIKNRWGLVALQVGLDATVGAAIINSGYFAMQTVFNAVLTGKVFPLPTLVSSVKHKVRMLSTYFEVCIHYHGGT